jgi:cytochrome P450 family 110
MQETLNLPNGPEMPILLRRFKFVFQPLKYVDDFAETYGDCFTIRGRDNISAVYFGHPQALEQIFTTDPSNFEVGRGNQDLRFLLGKNSMILLHGDRMRAYGKTMVETAQKVSNQWVDGKPFNIRGAMQEITLRVILRAVFGLDEGQRFQELQQLLSELLDLMGSPLMSASLIFSFLQRDFGVWSLWGRVERLKQRVDELIYALIQERREESNGSRQDILSLMMAARYEDGQSMSDEELHDELMTLLVAGHETTASGLTWAFYWVDRLPEVRDKLLIELASLGKEADPTVIAKSPYLTAVCQETLRIYPIAMNAFFRVAKSPIEIMGYKLPVGTRIIPSIYMAHHREEVFPQSKQFKPERFLERQFSPYEYLPFGGGHRRCIGIAFAMYEMKIVLATILSQFQVSSLSKRPVLPVRRGMTLAAPSGMRMVAKLGVEGGARAAH